MERISTGRDFKQYVRPLDPIARLGLLYYAVATQLPPRHSIYVPANRHLFALAWEISKGRVASQPHSELRKKLFPDYKTLATGVENIPMIGSFMIASNHYSEGPLKGTWQIPAIADIVLNKTDDSKKRRFRFIMDSEKDSTGIFGETVKDEFRKRQRHTLSNIAAALDYLPIDKTRETIELLLKGQKGNEILGVFPTGKAEFTFKTPVSTDVGNLFEIAGRYDIPVLHIGAWHDSQKKTFIINIGKATIYKNNPNDPNSKQTTAEKVMHSIASLLPAQMRGIYA